VTDRGEFKKGAQLLLRWPRNVAQLNGKYTLGGSVFGKNQRNTHP